MKKGKKRKERFINLVFKMDADPTCNPKMVIDPNDENQLGCRVKVVDENNQEIESVLCEMQGFYQGDKRDKVLFTQPANGNQFRANIDAELIKSDIILVIDTSYDPKADPRMAFTAIMAYEKHVIDDDTYVFKIIPTLVKWDSTSTEKPENFMYCLAIKDLRAHYQKIKKTPRIAVIVDSDLENIRSYNDKTKAIYGKYFLPEGFFIFYASSDRGSEYFQNKLLKMCDKKAQEALKEYKKGFENHAI